MNITFLIPHFRNGKTTAYCIHELLRYKNNHQIEIIVVSNSGKEGIEYVQPFEKYITLVYYPSDMLQSHGIGYDFLIKNNLVSTEYFITLESDAFPTQDNWLDYYEKLINEGYESGGSLLRLSGGTYVHPAGAFYKKSIWREAKEYCDKIEYTYFPNMSVKEGFDCHLMIHNSVLERVISNPDDFFSLANGYYGLSKEAILGRAEYYRPCTGVFHNGMGNNDESVKTYGNRNTDTEQFNVILTNKRKLINRIGFEPGQWFSYWQVATNKKVVVIPTEVKWLPDRENQQQEYTLTQNGLKHIWAGSSFLDMKGTAYNDVYEFKKNQIEELYNSLPKQYKVA